jgi:RNA polymerase-binding transcription factor DksA
MNNHDELTKKLKEEEAILTMELKQLGRIVDKTTGEWEAVPENDLPESDENDLADRFQDFEEKSAMLNILEARLKDVKEAMAKMKEDSYGVCVVCVNKIEQERLMANPAAKTCMTDIEK